MRLMQIVLLITLFSVKAFAQQPVINFLDSGHNASLRGLSVVTDSIIWVSGSNGTVARSTNGGKSFEWLTVKGYEQRDFRDIEAFDANTAIIMAIAEPAVMLQTKNGGQTWTEVFYNETKGMFLDAMDFDEYGNGIVAGDPINNKIFIATTDDFGQTWRTLKDKHNNYNVANGEAMFAASGTNIKITGPKSNRDILLITGGTKTRLFLNGLPVDLNIMQGKDSQGANSIGVNPVTDKIIIVGGDFNEPTLSEKNCELLTYRNNQVLTTFPKTQPHGYRSCIAFITNDKLICCGLNGADISNDGGINWQLISTESFHVCAKAKNGNGVFLAGKNGRIAKLVMNSK